MFDTNSKSLMNDDNPFSLTEICKVHQTENNEDIKKLEKRLDDSVSDLSKWYELPDCNMINLLNVNSDIIKETVNVNPISEPFDNEDLFVKRNDKNVSSEKVLYYLRILYYLHPFILFWLEYLCYLWFIVYYIIISLPL